MIEKHTFFDKYLVVPIIILTLISLVFIFSSSAPYAGEKYLDPYYFFERQIIALSVGIFISSFVLFIPISFYRENGAIFILLSLLLLVLVLIPSVGTEVNGSRRWLRIVSFNLQPSEVAKVLVPLYLCGYSLRRKRQLETSWWGFSKPLVLILIFCILLFLEPDYGATIVLFCVGMVVLFCGGAKISQLGILLVSFFVLMSILIYFNEERFSRLISFTDPFDDIERTDYQLLMALIAIINGNWFGLGIGESTQKYFFLPEAHTDFIFSIYVEETGFAGILILFTCYLTMLYRIYRLAYISYKKNYTFNSFIIISFGFLFFVQTLANIFVNVGLIPTKGLPLPFISYGGSSIIMNFIFLSVAMRASWEFRNGIK